MRAKADALIGLRLIFSLSPTFLSFSSISSLPRTLTLTPNHSNETLTEQVVVEAGDGSADVFRRCGCSDSEILKIFLRQPSLRKTNQSILESKLSVLRCLGLTGSDLVKIIHCRPRFLASRIDRGLDERLEFLESLFGSREMLLKAIIRNPSLLTYDLQDGIKRSISLYEGMGISRQELVPMLMSRPTLIPRSSLDNEKLDYICRSGASKGSKMYKYVVTLIAISRLETIREKLANLEKFGFSSDEVIALFGRSPLVLTLSVDKVQRNMTFILGTMKLQASAVLFYPFLLYFNLETVLKPRVVVADKIRAMGLLPQIKGPVMLSALRMTEQRFLRAFVTCHTKDVANDLMECYTKAKGIKRLAEASKRIVRKGFPF